MSDRRKTGEGGVKGWATRRQNGTDSPTRLRAALRQAQDEIERLRAANEKLKTEVWHLQAVNGALKVALRRLMLTNATDAEVDEAFRALEGK